MTIDDMSALARARLVYLSQILTSYTTLGDVEGMTRTESEIAQTQATLDSLLSL